MVPKRRYETILILKRKESSGHEVREEYLSSMKQAEESADEDYFLETLEGNQISKKKRDSRYTKKDLENAIEELASRYGKREFRKDCGKLDKVGLRQIALKYNIPKSTLQDRFGKYKGKRILPKGQFMSMCVF